MKYYSKVDIWLVVPLYIGVLLPFLWGISFLFNPGVLRGIGWYFLCLGIAISAIVLLLTYPVYYEITATTLLVRSGVIRVKIPLNAIQRVFPERSRQSAPALSLDRLRVDYSRYSVTRRIHISPKDKLRFMQDLTEHTEGLEVKDGQVIRRH